MKKLLLAFSSLIIISLVFFKILPEQESFEAKANNGEYVIILHGILRSSSHMKPVAKLLKKQGYQVLNLDYPSTKHKLEELVEITQKNIEKHNIGDKKVHFIGYSMGGLLTRGILNKYRPKNLGKVIQLASPNHGSEVADFLKNNFIYKKFYGPAGLQLTTKNPLSEKFLGKVDYNLGVIAGNSSIDPISSFIIKGDDDGKVSVKSTKVAGMKDHITVKASHTFFPSNKKVHKQILAFLNTGKFQRK